MKNFLLSIPKEFMKLWLFIDYVVLFGLLAVFIVGWFKGFDISTIGMVLTAWIAEIGLSTAAYAWKAKNENCCINFLNRIMESIPKEYKEQINVNDIILAIINMPRN